MVHATLVQRLMAFMAFVGSLGTSGWCQAQVIYFTGEDSSTFGAVCRAEVGTNVVETLYTTAWGPRPIGVTVDGTNVYWTTYTPGSIWRGTTNGSPASRLLQRNQDSYTRHIEFAGGWMYWNEEGTGQFMRSRPDGTEVRTMFSGVLGQVNGLWDIAIHGDRVYWTSWDSDRIKSAKLDGTDRQTFAIPGAQRLFSIDSNESGLLVSDYSARRLWFTDFDGSNPRLLGSLPLGDGEVVSVSLFEDRAYWGYTRQGRSFVDSMMLDGTGRRTDLDVGIPARLFQIDVVPAPSCALVLAVAGTVGLRTRRR